MAKRKDLNAEIDARLTKAGIPHYSEPIYRVSASAFTKAIRKGKASIGKNGWMVDLHTKEEYKNMKTYLSRDGKAGVAITKDGDIVSVFNGGNKKGAMGSLIPFAIAHGGVKLDAYGGGLQNMYARYGGVVTGKTPFNKEYAPPGWDGSEFPVVAMYMPRTLTGVINRYNPKPNISLSSVKTFRSYDKMLADRDRKMNGQVGLISNLG